MAHDGEITTPIPKSRTAAEAARVRVRRGMKLVEESVDRGPAASPQRAPADARPAERVQVHTAVQARPRTGLARGAIVGGCYRIVERLARGGSAIVYRAFHTELKREVALKVLVLAGTVDDHSFETRFVQEAKALVALQHPHIVEVVDFGRLEDGRPYLAMEFVDGPRLNEVFRDTEVGVADRLEILAQVADALAHAHATGVIHRDVKLSNVMALPGPTGWTVKVLDFGLARLVEEDQELTRQGVVMGSPHFMSPEQARGQVLDSRTDIYSLGVLAWVAFTGCFPFSGPTPAATMVQHCVEPVPMLSMARTLFPVPEGLSQVVSRCMAKEPDARIARMEDLAIALRAAAERARKGYFIGLGAPEAVVLPPPANLPPPVVVASSPPSHIRLALLAWLLVSTACLWWQEEGAVPPPWAAVQLERR